MTISTRQNENPRGGLPLGFSCSLGELLLLGCRCLLISVQPFAYVGTNYSCYNRDKKSDDEVFHATTSFLLEVRQLLHHITFLLNVLLVIFRSRSYCHHRIQIFPLYFQFPYSSRPNRANAVSSKKRIVRRSEPANVVSRVRNATSARYRRFIP